MKDHGIRITVDGRGRAIGGIMIQRLWRTVKCGDIYIKEHETVEQPVDGLKISSRSYNKERRHQSLGDKTPAEVYFEGSELGRAA